MQTADRSLPTQYHFCNDPQTNCLRYGCNGPRGLPVQPYYRIFHSAKPKTKQTPRLKLEPPETNRPRSNENPAELDSFVVGRYTASQRNAQKTT